jgi:hypothetical protein
MALGMSTASVRAEVRRRDVRTVVKVAVEPSERLDGTRHESLDLILLGDVDFECLGNAAGGRDGLSRGTGAVDVQITDDDLGIFASQAMGRRGSDCGRTTGDDDDLVLQSISHFLRPPLVSMDESVSFVLALCVLAIGRADRA